MAGYSFPCEKPALESVPWSGFTSMTGVGAEAWVLAVPKRQTMKRSLSIFIVSGWEVSRGMRGITPPLAGLSPKAGRFAAHSRRRARGQQPPQIGRAHV